MTSLIKTSLLALAFVSIFTSCEMATNNSSNSSSDSQNNATSESYESRLAKVIGNWKTTTADSDGDYYTLVINNTTCKRYYTETRYDEMFITPMRNLTSEMDYLDEHTSNYEANDLLLYREYSQGAQASFGKKYGACALKLNETTNILTFTYLATGMEEYYSRSSGSGDSGSTTTLSGTYTITQAISSSFTMNNGNWTYNYNGNTNNGTYNQSGNDLTVNYLNSGGSLSAVFTVSESNGTVTLVGKSGDTTSILALAFMITDSNAIANETITMTHQ